MADVTSSVESYINAQPEEIMDWNAYYNMRGREDHGGSWIDADPDFWFTKVADVFAGNIPKYRNQYKAYLENVNNRNEFIAQQSARAWDKLMDDTKYQRMMRDYAAAGLNPYSIVNNSGISASSLGSSAKANYKTDQKIQEKKSNLSGIALLIMAAMKVAATLL